MSKAPTRAKRKRRKDQPIQLKAIKNKSRKKIKSNRNNCDSCI